MRRSVRASSIAAIAIAAGLSSFAACSDEERGSGAPDADAAGASGAGAGGGSGGVLAAGGSSGQGGGGAGGVGGAGAQWGAYPIWEAIPGGAVDCKFERLANAPEVTMFTWQPCAGDVGCEQAVLNPVFAGDEYSFSFGSSVHDDGDETRIGLDFNLPKTVVLVAAADGRGLDGFRPLDIDPTCSLSGAKIWKQRLAIKIRPSDNLDRHGGILADIASSSPPTFFEAPQPLPPGAPAPHAIGDARWLWWWAPKNSLTSVSTVDGSGFAAFATVQGADLAFDGATSTGPLFLFNHLFAQDGGTLGWHVAYSDGIAAPKPYVVAPAGSHFGYPTYAHSHVAFMRGVNQVDLNVYDSVELWAAPYSAEPQALKPELVGPLASTYMSDMAGGWGHVGKHDLLPNDQHGVEIWNLEKKTKLVRPIPEGQVGVGGLLGMTRTHFWLGTAIKGKSGLRFLLRYPAE